MRENGGNVFFPLESFCFYSFSPARAHAQHASARLTNTRTIKTVYMNRGQGPETPELRVARQRADCGRTSSTSVKYKLIRLWFFYIIDSDRKRTRSPNAEKPSKRPMLNGRRN